LQKLEVVEDFIVVDSIAEFPFHRVFRPTGRDVREDVREKLFE
jgi:hypothetical protein